MIYLSIQIRRTEILFVSNVIKFDDMLKKNGRIWIMLSKKSAQPRAVDTLKSGQPRAVDTLKSAQPRAVDKLKSA